MKWLAAGLLIALVLLQYRLWVSNDGVHETLRLQAAVAAQTAENARLSERNRQLAAEVRDLKQGYAALEERARSELGMITGNETFYQVVPQKSVLTPTLPTAPASDAAQRTAAAR
jgi:cell division protein FtsB